MGFVVTIDGTDALVNQVVGFYLTEKEAKNAAKNVVDVSETMTFKRKIIKKDDTSDRKLLFVQDVKENPSGVYMTFVDYKLPETKKKVKDPLAPKRGLSAFMLYSQDHRAKVKASHPDAKFSDMGKMLGAGWAALNDKQKAVYVKKSAADKVRAETEIEAYQAKTATATATEAA